MPNSDEPTKFPRGACPNCGSKNLRRVKVPENELVVIHRRGCNDCGTVFSPAVSPLLVIVTIPLALLVLAFVVWATFISELAGKGVDALTPVAFASGLCLVFATVQILKQREPRIHSTPPKEREAKPWDKPQGGE